MRFLFFFAAKSTFCQWKFAFHMFGTVKLINEGLLDQQISDEYENYRKKNILLRWNEINNMAPIHTVFAKSYVLPKQL